MDTLFHFVFPFFALMIARIKFKHRLPIAFVMAASAALLDVDHFFGMVPRGTLHNVFVTLLLPLSIFVIAFLFEKKGTYIKNVSLTLALFLFSHPLADVFTGQAPVKMFYPLSNMDVWLNSFKVLSPIPMANGFVPTVVDSGGIGLLIYFLMILSVIFVEDFIKILMRVRNPERAFERTVKKEEKKIEKEF